MEQIGKVLEDPKEYGSLEQPEEIATVLPTAFYITNSGERTKERKVEGKKTPELFWKSKLTIILTVMIILSGGLLYILLEWFY